MTMVIGHGVWQSQTPSHWLSQRPMACHLLGHQAAVWWLGVLHTSTPQVPEMTENAWLHLRHQGEGTLTTVFASDDVRRRTPHIGKSSMINHAARMRRNSRHKQAALAGDGIPLAGAEGKCGLRRRAKAREGSRRMPWRQGPKKDVAHCEKPREVVCRRRTGDVRMGKPTRG